MPAVSEAIVREYFESHGFLVRQQRKYVGQGRAVDEEDVDFFVLNPLQSSNAAELPFVLASGDLKKISRGVVVVKAWHSNAFGPAVLAHARGMFKFLEPRVFKHTLEAFGEDAVPLKILVVPSLPHSDAARKESITLLGAKGVDAVLPFRTMLADLVAQTDINRNYQKSDLLQTIRILKNYDLLKDPQLELFRPRKKRAAKKPPGQTPV